jgi:hypothetical protein
MGGSCGREKSLPVLSRSVNLHESAHPFDSGRAENINRLDRSITMKRTPKGAPAPKFVIISNSKYFTASIGTKEQLLALGAARIDHFPEGSKRVKRTYKDGESLQIRRVRGGWFELKKWHPARESIKSPVFNFEVPLGRNEAGYIQWSLSGGCSDLFGKFTSGYSYRDLAKAADLIAETLEHEIRQHKRNRLTLVKRSPSSTRSLSQTDLEVQHG